MLLSELQRKDIININNGKKIGRIIDAEIDSTNGNLKSFVIEQSKYIKSMFRSDNDIKINYNQIKKMGQDVILVDLQ